MIRKLLNCSRDTIRLRQLDFAKWWRMTEAELQDKINEVDADIKGTRRRKLQRNTLRLHHWHYADAYMEYHFYLIPQNATSANTATTRPDLSRSPSLACMRTGLLSSSSISSQLRKASSTCTSQQISSRVSISDDQPSDCYWSNQILCGRKERLLVLPRVTTIFLEALKKTLVWLDPRAEDHQDTNDIFISIIK